MLGLREGRGGRERERQRVSKKKEREKKKVKAPRLFRPCGLVPPGIAEHCQDSALQNQSLSTGHKEKDMHVRSHIHTVTLTHAKKHTFTHNMLQAMSSVPVQLSARQPQSVMAVSYSESL